jgi:hypothetical protein
MWPVSVMEIPSFHHYKTNANIFSDTESPRTGEWKFEAISTLLNPVSGSFAVSLGFDLAFLYVLCLSGLVVTLSVLGNLIRPDGTTPRNRWLFIICGVASIISGLMSGPPILISPESTAGVKAGAKTGLSSIVCGVLFALSVFFGPILKSIPFAATSPVLILVGVILFQNVGRLDWKVMKNAVPAYFVLFFVPFTYSVLQGVAVGYSIYLTVAVFTGDLYTDGRNLWNYYYRDYIAYSSSEYESYQSSAAQSPLTDCTVSPGPLANIGALDDSNVGGYDEGKYGALDELTTLIISPRFSRPSRGNGKRSEGKSGSKRSLGCRSSKSSSHSTRASRDDSSRRSSMDGLDLSVCVFDGAFVDNDTDDKACLRQLSGEDDCLV